MLAAQIIATHNAGVSPTSERKGENPGPESITTDPPATLAETVKATMSKGALLNPPQQTAARRDFEFPGVLASVPEYCDQMMEFVYQYCSDEGDRIDIFVAVQEALANAALHEL